MLNIQSKITKFREANLICRLIIDAGGEVRFIGGFVRDILCNKSISDIDLATNFTPDQIEDILIKNKVKYFTIGKEFGTITAILAEEEIQITSLRKDISCDGRYAKVEFTNNWQEDAMRRDFTINALSVDIDGNVYDYFEGLTDLQKKKVRFIGNAEDRIKEDYLRILRFFRFSSYFAQEIDKPGLEASNRYASNLKKISSTRINNELSKTFTSSNAINIVKHMQIVLQQIIPFDVVALKYLKNLYVNANQYNYKLSAISCFAILFRHCNTADIIINNLAFSREEQKHLRELVKSKIVKWDYQSLKQYWCKYKNKLKEIILINLSEQKANHVLTSNLNQLFSQAVKALPIRGEDLMKIGVEPGKDLGKLLKVADQIWYDREFKISKKQLLKEIYDAKL